MQTRDNTGTVGIDGDIYHWELRRQPRPLSGGKWEGIAVTLRLAETFPNIVGLEISPANLALCRLFKVAPLEFDGINDSVFHPFNRDGAKLMIG